jgi:hypothetical protein
MFDNPPGCWLHRQATFINAFFPKGTEYGVDYSAFPFPRSISREACSPGARGRLPQLAGDQGLPRQVQREEFQCAMGGDPVYPGSRRT